MMMRSLAIAVGAIVLAQGTQQAPPPTFRAGADAVTIEVSVRDRSKPVLGLASADFLVSDDGVPQTVATVSYGIKPIDVTVVLDVSLSVTGQMLDRLRRAVRQLMTDRGPEDRLKLIMFNSRVVRVVDFTTDAKAVDEAIRTATAGGGSSILDAVSVAAVAASDPDRRHLVMIFTDASDSSSVLTPEVVTRVVERTTSAVSAVVTLRNFGTSSNAPGSGTSLLQLLARNSGGVYLPILGQRQDLTAAFKQALDEFRSTYVLHYTPAGVAAGGFHSLAVSVRDRNGLTVKARRGYFR
jgi:VWFA-related protein